MLHKIVLSSELLNEMFMELLSDFEHRGYYGPKETEYLEQPAKVLTQLFIERMNSIESEARRINSTRVYTDMRDIEPNAEQVLRQMLTRHNGNLPHALWDICPPWEICKTAIFEDAFKGDLISDREALERYQDKKRVFFCDAKDYNSLVDFTTLEEAYENVLPYEKFMELGPFAKGGQN
jgi:hypothetical protein